MALGKFFCGAAVVATMAFAGAAQASNIVVNGSFENPVVASGSFVYTDFLPGWKMTGDAMVEVRNNVAGQAYDQDNYVELDSTKNMSIWQDLATVIGQTYQISFMYSPRMNQPASTNPIAVTWNGVALPGSPYTGTGGSTGNEWVMYTFNVVADSVLSTLKFSAGGTSDSFGGGLDAVSVSAVPLPGAALLFGSAMLGAGVLRRRKAANEAEADALAA
ncbi:hypothetical protein [Comamonas flocculans]|uniref:DUF642 domain-containing protein n=1 Tax=Comamonas flocculans TaxID=2597701 RepID=A0A5B8RS69_9BURK|nr:hypothetical protein [Comamonas flocculans]QEA12499.1 hypothetical protein FOZ74_05335 [Comamonas flocculans]